MKPQSSIASPAATAVESKPSASALLMTAAAPVPNDVAHSILAARYGITGAVTRLPGERDQNFLVEELSGRKLLFKIAHPAEDPDVTDLQAAVLVHLLHTDPELPVQRLLPNKDGQFVERALFEDGATRAIRVASFVEGVMLHEVTPSPELHRNLGKMLAQIGLALRNFEHPAAHYPLSWDIQHSPSLLSFLPAIADANLRDTLARILSRFSLEISPRMADLRKQVVHNDFSTDNVLIAYDDAQTISGVLDFGDMAHTPLVNDVAVAAAYLLGDSDHLLIDAATLIGGYHSINPLKAEEQALLFDLIVTRMAMRIAITEARAIEFPDNGSYILRNTPRVRLQLAQLLNLDHDLAQGQLIQFC